MPVQSTEVRLAAYATGGWPTEDIFDVARTTLPDPAPGQVVLRNLVMSVDPTMRGRMSGRKTYVEPFTVGEVMDGPAIGEVLTSTVESLAPGDVVLHSQGWRDYALVDATSVTKIDPDLVPLNAYLGVLGTTGLTAYVGLLEVAKFTAGDTVFVSGAAGAVGQIVGQLAKLNGAAKVIGSAGSADKVAHLVDELGFDAAFNYKDAPVAEQLRAAAPDGIDVYFDNVGGEHLEAAIDVINTHGRIAVCGMISQYNATEPTPAPRNLIQIIAKRLTLHGFLVFDHLNLQDRFLAEVAPLISDNTLRHSETVLDGLVNAPQAFLGLLRGENTGKMLVKIADRQEP